MKHNSDAFETFFAESDPNKLGKYFLTFKVPKFLGFMWEKDVNIFDKKIYLYTKKHLSVK